MAAPRPCDYLLLLFRLLHGILAPLLLEFILTSSFSITLSSSEPSIWACCPANRLRTSISAIFVSIWLSFFDSFVDQISIYHHDFVWLKILHLDRFGPFIKLLSYLASCHYKRTILAGSQMSLYWLVSLAIRLVMWSLDT